MPSKPRRTPLCIRVNIDDLDSATRYTYPRHDPSHTLCLRASGISPSEIDAICALTAVGGDLYHGPHLLVLVPLDDDPENKEDLPDE